MQVGTLKKYNYKYIILKNLNFSKLRTVLTNRFLKFMIDMAQKDPVGYDTFYRDYSLFLKEGIVTSQSPMEKVYNIHVIRQYFITYKYWLED